MIFMEFDVTNTKRPSSAGLIPDVFPKVQDDANQKNSDTGVTTRSILSTAEKTESTKNAQWYVLKTTYGREKKACDYLMAKNVKTFYPTINKIKEIRGKRKSVMESRLPNLFFAYGTENELTPLVQRNPLIPFLRYYCRYYTDSGSLRRQIITVPQRQMDSLIKICKSEDEDILLYTENIHKFEKGEWVRVIKGPFSGVVGKVARFKGQQRVGVVIDGLLTAVTAYIPSAYIEKIENKNDE